LWSKFLDGDWRVGLFDFSISSRICCPRINERKSPMTVNRRDFLIRGSAAAAAVGAGALLPGLQSSAGASENQNSSLEDQSETAPKADGAAAVPLVARIRDVRTGEMDLFFGEHEVTYHDPQLAARLYKAAQ
jgi:hypothetical protein